MLDFAILFQHLLLPLPALWTNQQQSKGERKHSMCKRKQGAVIQSMLGETKNWLVLTLMEMKYDLHFLVQQQQ